MNKLHKKTKTCYKKIQVHNINDKNIKGIKGLKVERVIIWLKKSKMEVLHRNCSSQYLPAVQPVVGKQKTVTN